MPVQRGLVPPAIVSSTVIMELCVIAWGALGVLSIATPNALPTATHRYLAMLLATLTICSVMFNLYARLVQLVRSALATDDGYAAGYADGIGAQPGAAPPGVSRLVRAPR